MPREIMDDFPKLAQWCVHEPSAYCTANKRALRLVDHPMHEAEWSSTPSPDGVAVDRPLGCLQCPAPFFLQPRSQGRLVCEAQGSASGQDLQFLLHLPSLQCRFLVSGEKYEAFDICSMTRRVALGHWSRMSMSLIRYLQPRSTDPASLSASVYLTLLPMRWRGKGF